MTALHVPAHVHSGRTPQGGTALLNTRTGQWHLLNGTAHRLWVECGRTGDLDTAITALVRRFPGAPAADVRGDAERAAEALLHRGLLVRARPRPAAARPTPPPAEPAGS
ncbi:PqqD family protein, partial [Streptomyces sp. YIM 98790]|uniref:PqqD family protein n=1 Tax=Streptomyces sp. YIM 98790 TaxID=2689077 RepID=UPI001408ADFE